MDWKIFKLLRQLRVATRLALWPIVWFASCPAIALVGGGNAPGESIARSIVTFVGSRGTSCTGTLIANDLVLTAAHCIAPDTTYKLVDYESRPPRLLDIRRIAAHPKFRMQDILGHRASADVALLQLAAPMAAPKSSAALGLPSLPL